MFTVAVVGATGLVGQKMLKVLEERNFPVKRLIPIASQQSAGEKIRFRGEELTVQPLSESVFDGVDYALFSAGAAISREFAPKAVARGVTVIDNSSAWRMDSKVPLIVPEVNPHAVSAEDRLIANPNCSTIQMVVALKPLHDRFRIKRIVVATYQAVTGSGKQAVQQLHEELTSGTASNPFYPHPIAFNCLPHIDVFQEDGYTKEEHKMIFETHKIMEDDTIGVSPTAVRVPVLGGHSEAINVEFAHSFNLNEVYEILQQAPGVTVVDNPAQNEYPMPLYAEDKDDVFVGRIRRDPSIRNGLNLWVVSDNLRKGAATNAVQIAELMITKRSH